MVTTKAKNLVVKSALCILDLAGLGADQSYQREVKKGHKRIVADFDEQALGIPLVGERSDGSRWIVDGLQRITALRKLGKKKVRAEVFASDGPEHEARVFKLVNLDRAKLIPKEQFRALLAAQDAEAWAIKEAVESVGFRLALGKSGADATAAKELTCISALTRIARRHGTEAIVFTLRCIAEAWPGDRLGANHSMIIGLALLHGRLDGVVDLERLMPRLKTVTPHKVMYAAQQATLGGDKATAVADVLEKVYRKRLSVR